MAPTLYDEKPQLGDLIEIFRGTYQHWAVYVGDDCVVHLAPPSEIPGAGANSLMSVLSEKAFVKRERLWDVVGTHQWKVNNSLDGDYKPRPAEVIVKEACAMVGQELSYCVFRGNCEHFVNELRYGKAESRQVRKAGELALAAGAATMFVVGAAALANVLFGGKKKEDKSTH